MKPQMEPPMDEETVDQHWHITRGIPVAFIVTFVGMIFMQTATAAWFISAMTQRVDAIERAQAQAAPLGDRLTRVEERLSAVQTGISDIKTSLTAQGRPQR